MLVVTADSLPRLMACNGSRLMPHNPAFNVDDTLQKEGEAAHWLIEQVFKKRHGLDELVDRKAPNGVLITGEMVEHVTTYLEDIRGKGDVESDTSHGDGVSYQVNGRADHIFFDSANHTLYVDDFKYGWSLVEPEGNWTLLSHVFGFLGKHQAVLVEKVTLRIFQPRPYHPEGKIRSVDYSIQEINEFWSTAQKTLKSPTDVLNTTIHCYKCPAMATCPARQKSAMSCIDVSEMAYVANMDNGSLAFLLEQSDRAITILEQNHKAYAELALHRIKEGQIIPGFVVEKELTNRQWKENITVETALLLTGKDLGKKQMITPAQAIKMGVNEQAIDAMCERREKGVKLVRMDANKAAKKLLKGGK